MELAVIADDITGALDTGVQFKKWGLNVEIFMDIEEIETSESTDIVITDTESRYDAPETAYDKVYSVAERLTRSGFDIIYKKIDSTFRGNIGAELDALMDVTKEDLVYLCPAYPLNGRTVKSGCLHV